MGATVAEVAHGADEDGAGGGAGLSGAVATSHLRSVSGLWSQAGGLGCQSTCRSKSWTGQGF